MSDLQFLYQGLGIVCIILIYSFLKKIRVARGQRSFSAILPSVIFGVVGAYVVYVIINNVIIYGIVPLMTNPDGAFYSMFKDDPLAFLVVYSYLAAVANLGFIYLISKSAGGLRSTRFIYEIVFYSALATSAALILRPIINSWLGLG